MTNIDEMLESKNHTPEYADTDAGACLIVVNERDPLIRYEQPGVDASVTLSMIIANGDWERNLGLDPEADLHYKRARSADESKIIPPVPLAVKGSVRDATLGELGFFEDGFDTLVVNSGGING